MLRRLSRRRGGASASSFRAPHLSAMFASSALRVQTQTSTPLPTLCSSTTLALQNFKDTVSMTTLQASARSFSTSATLCAPKLTSTPSSSARKHRSGRRSSGHSNSKRSRRGSQGAHKVSSKQRSNGVSTSSNSYSERNADVARAAPSEGVLDDFAAPQVEHPEEQVDDAMDGAGTSTTHDATNTEAFAGTAATSSPQQHDGSSEPGWGLESVDAITGKTALEALYDRNLSRIHRILEQPLPPMPQDGSVDPDFFVGFASYSYQLRDQYRAVIARELQVPVKAVRLSVAWSGRFNVKRFNRVQKVCGVCLDRGLLSRISGEAAVEDDGDGGTPGRDTETARQGELSDAMQRRIATLISDINTHTREDLLQVQLFQASPPIPEVEFALTRQEHRLLYHLHVWLRQHVLQRAVAVVVYGVPPPPLPTSFESPRHAQQRVSKQPYNKDSGKANTKKNATGSTDASETSSEATAAAQARFAAWQQEASAEAEVQHREVQSRWLRLFHRREVVPAVLSLTELATRLAIAVAEGRCAGVRCAAAVEPDSKAQAGHEESVCLSGPLSDLVRQIADAALVASNNDGKNVQTASSSATENAGEGPVSEAGQAASHLAIARAKHTVKDVFLPLAATRSSAATQTDRLELTTPTQQEAAMRWVRLVFQGLFLRETHGGQMAGSAAAPSSTTPRATASTVSLDISLPALFAQGVYAGSRDEVAYLQHNRTAMDALLLHPHEISFKKKFVSRLRNGHRRPQMEAEAAALHSNSG